MKKVYHYNRVNHYKLGYMNCPWHTEKMEKNLLYNLDWYTICTILNWLLRLRLIAQTSAHYWYWYRSCLHRIIYFGGMRNMLFCIWKSFSHPPNKNEIHIRRKQDTYLAQYLAHVIEQPIFRIPNLEYLQWNFVYLLDQQ